MKNADVGASPASAASWSDTTNWKDGVVPSSIDSDTADIDLADGSLVGPKIQSSSATDAVRLSVPEAGDQTVSNVTTFAGTLTTAKRSRHHGEFAGRGLAITSKGLVAL